MDCVSVLHIVQYILIVCIFTIICANIPDSNGCSYTRTYYARKQNASKRQSTQNKYANIHIFNIIVGKILH